MARKNGILDPHYFENAASEAQARKVLHDVMWDHRIGITVTTEHPEMAGVVLVDR